MRVAYVDMGQGWLGIAASPPPAPPGIRIFCLYEAVHFPMGAKRMWGGGDLC